MTHKVQRAIYSLKSRREREEGFTLIELMVVVLIIAILIAIAIPTFLSSRRSAQDRAAQSDLRNALVAAKTHYTDEQSYAAPEFTTAVLTTMEPSLLNAAITVDSVDDNTVILSKTSKTGELFAICESVVSGTKYFEGAAAPTTYAGCTLSEW